MYKILIIHILLTMLFTRAQSQYKFELSEEYFVRNSFRKGNFTYVLAKKGSQLDVIKVNKRFRHKKIFSIDVSNSSNNFHKIYVNDRKRVFILFDNQDYVVFREDSIYKDGENHRLLTCHKTSGKLLWSKKIHPFNRVRDFDFNSSTRDGLIVGFEADRIAIFDNDTILFNGKNKNSVVVNLNRKGQIIKSYSFAGNYNSSDFYKLGGSEKKPILLASNYEKRTSVSSIKMFALKDSMTFDSPFYPSNSPFFFSNDRSNTFLNKTNIRHAIEDGGNWYLVCQLNKLNSNVHIRKLNSTTKKLATLEIEEDTNGAESDFNDIKIFNEKKYLIYSRCILKRESGKKWYDSNSVEYAVVFLTYIRKSDFKPIFAISKQLKDVNNWISIENANENEVGIIIDGKYKVVDIVNFNRTQQQ